MSSTTSYLPSSLKAGNFSVSLRNLDNQYYMGSHVGTKSDILYAIAVATSWNGSETVRAKTTLPPFTVYSDPTAAPVPSPTSFPTSAAKFIYQESGMGETMAVRFDAVLSGTSAALCANISAAGTSSSVSVSFYFDPYSDTSASWPADMELVVYGPASSPGSRPCFQVGGYNTLASGCTQAASWPESFASTDAGLYAATVAAGSISGTGIWSVCISNGYDGASPVRYAGNASVAGVTSDPAVSAINIYVSVSYTCMTCALVCDMCSRRQYQRDPLPLLRPIVPRRFPPPPHQ